MKGSRLFKIIYILLNKGRATAPELAEEFEVSVRTIYRDIDSLSEAGVPIYTESGRNGGIFLLDSYTVDKVLISEEEKQEILYSLQSLTVLFDNQEKEILTKLSALFKMRYDSWFEVDFSRWGNTTIDNNKFELLKEAIINNKTISIEYINSNGTKNTRDINPIKMFYKSKNWYIKAFCTLNNDFRIFKFNRVLKIVVSNKVFDFIEFPNTQNNEFEKYNEVTLCFKKEVSYRVYDEFNPSQIEEKQNGDLIVTSAIPEDSWLIGYLLSFGASVNVIYPRYLRKKLSEEAKKILENNKW